jgi:peptide/nickel transport system permease protein
MVSFQEIERRIKLTYRSIVESWQIFRLNKQALFGFFVLLFLISLAIIPAFYAPYDPRQRGDVPDQYNDPSWKHLLGTDDVGRDVLSRIIFGTRASLTVGFVAAFVSVMIGTFVGIFSGYYGGTVGELLMRFTDIFLVIPMLPLQILLAALLKPSIWNIILAISLVAWTGTARIIRSMALTLRERTYVERARSVGCSDIRILLRYILPSVFPVAFANTIIGAINAIASEAFLSFIGLGDPTMISWGTILHFAFVTGSFTRGAWWLFLSPGLMIVTTMVTFNLMGMGLDEVLSPKLRRI